MNASDTSNGCRDPSEFYYGTSCQSCCIKNKYYNPRRLDDYNLNNVRCYIKEADSDGFRRYTPYVKLWYSGTNYIRDGSCHNGYARIPKCA